MVLKTNEHIFTTSKPEDCITKRINLTKKDELPPTFKWDYSKELRVEDVIFWQVIHEECGGISGYASWSPYAELYMIHFGFDIANNHHIRLRLYEEKPKPNTIELFYGPGAQKQVQNRMREMSIPFSVNQTWVEPEDMWLYK